MARGFNLAFLAAIAIAALIQSSAAQTTYTVGDTSGWTIPTGGPAFYSSWAANKRFNVGDILVFNFAAAAHDVAKVTKADYDACTTSSPIVLATSSPARITLNTSGEHYFLCNFTGHCAAGQKLTVNVSAASSSPSPAPQASSPAPQPSTPTPQSSPAPQPSTPTPRSSPAPQPSTPTPASSPSPVSTPPPATTPTSGPSPPATTPTSGPSPPAASPTSGTPPPAPASATPPTTPPPPPNSATSLGFAGFTTFLSLFVAFLY